MDEDQVFEVGTSAEIRVTTVSQIIGETLGSFLLCFLGLGIGMTASNWSSSTVSFFPGIWGTTFTWGMTIGLAIYVAGPLSGAHFNPAVTLGLAAAGRHPWKKVPLYIICQFIGWFVGAAALAAIFYPAMQAKAVELGVPFHSERIGAMLTSYAPNPGFAGTTGYQTHNFWIGFAAEAICTGFLLLFILSVGAQSGSRPPDWAGAMIIGFAVGLLIMFAAPLSQASFNPTRDLGPRVMLMLMGFGEPAWPGTGPYTWSVISTTIGPIIGAVIASVIFDRTDKHLRASGIRNAVA